MAIATTRIALSLSLSAAIAASVAATAGARIPDVEQDPGVAQPQPAALVVPDAFERAVKRHSVGLRASVSVPDAFERAVTRRLDRRVTTITPPWP